MELHFQNHLLELFRKWKTQTKFSKLDKKIKENQIKIKENQKCTKLIDPDNIEEMMIKRKNKTYKLKNICNLCYKNDDKKLNKFFHCKCRYHKKCILKLYKQNKNLNCPTCNSKLYS